MEKSNSIILAVSIFSSIAFLIILIVFIIKLLKLYSNKQQENLNKIQILELENEKAILNTRITVQEETFSLIGREIHDNINQLLTLAKLNLNSIKFENQYDIQVKVDNGIQLIGEAIQGLSNISKSLNTDIIKETGITKILENEITRIHLINSCRIILTCDEEVNEISPEIQLIIFRISQEAIRNAITHGLAKTIEIELKILETSVIFEIKDDGIGFDPKLSQLKKSSQGLHNIEKRINAINGLLTIDTKIGHGTILKIVFPNIINQMSVSQ